MSRSDRGPDSGSDRCPDGRTDMRSVGSSPVSGSSAESHASEAGAQVTAAVDQLSGTRHDAATQRRVLGRLTRAMVTNARRAGVAGVTRGQWLADLLIEAAPRLPVRDLPTLREHHPGLDGEELADALVATTTRVTTGVGTAGGTLAALQYTAPTTLVYAPAQVAAETVAVAAAEVKLIAELHEVYGVQVPGTGTQRAVTFVQLWTRRRGFDPADPVSLPRAIAPATRSELQRRLMLRASRNVSTLGPLFTGAIAGATLNRRATQKLATLVRRDLRGRSGP